MEDIKFIFQKLLLVLFTIFFINFIQAQGWEYIGESILYPEYIEETTTGEFKIISVDGNSYPRDITTTILSPQGERLSSNTTSFEIDGSLSISGFHAIKTSTNEYMITTRVDTDNSEGYNLNSLVIKLSNEGDYIWHTMLDFDNMEEVRSIIETSDNNFLVIGSVEHGEFGWQDKISLFKVSPDGTILWSQIYETTSSSIKAINVFEKDNEIYLFGSRRRGRGFMIKTDLEGNELSSKDVGIDIEEDLNDFIDCKLLNDGNFLFYYRYNRDISLMKINPQGELIWTRSHGTEHKDYASDLIETSDGGLVITGEMNISGPEGPFTTIASYPFTMKLNQNGHLIWHKFYKNTRATYISNIIATADKGYLLGGGHEWSREYVLKIDSLGNLYLQKVFGNIFHDSDLDCDYDNGENLKENWIVELNGSKKFYTNSDANGNYCVEVDTGEYEVKLIPPLLYWGSCQSAYDISINDGDTMALDLPIQAVIDCPHLEVDISTPWLRRCFNNEYVVQYCNSGTIAAEDAYVEVMFDEFFTVNSSSIPSTVIDVPNNIFQFDLGNITSGACGSFTINVTVSCDSTIIGQTHCTTAQIFPNDYCFPPNPSWDGSSIELDGFCEGDSVSFRITNVGSEDMTEELEYLVIEDQLMLRQGIFLLKSGEDSTFTFYPDGSTIRLTTEQAAFHPGQSMPTIAIEGCGSFPFTTGYVTIFGEDDSDPFIAIDCQENRGAYDPNDKQGFPKGYGDDHFIEANTELEYMIRFQNTGTDTAFKVVVVDTLSPFLNPITFKSGASNHHYTYKLKGQGIIEFTFDNIMLPDSNTNLAASNGFIKFKIAQQENNPIGTVINNEAAIFFDFNAPIITNQTKHTIGENFIEVIMNANKLTESNIDIKVYPNPFTHSATIEIIDGNYDQIYFKLFDTQGKLIRQTFHKENRFSFERKQLPAGVYFFLIETEKGLLRNGKMIIQ